MAEQRFEVLYVDKFTETEVANHAHENLSKVFQLTPTHMEKLASGDPVVIKKMVSQEEADRYRQAVIGAGGVAWVQALDTDCIHRERRQSKRRHLVDRRGQFRASSIQPDRRQSCGRRSTDGVSQH